MRVSRNDHNYSQPQSIGGQEYLTRALMPRGLGLTSVKSFKHSSKFINYLLDFHALFGSI